MKIVDHFNFANPDTFKIRYLINSDYWSPESGAPIFFYTGNEGDIELFANNTGFLWETAPEFKALIIFAEHRYYGKSLPYGNQTFTDPEHWGYLTAEQAMADYVDLITHIRNQKIKGHCSAKRSPVIAFGGSYGGMIAAWIRMKYPDAIAGSLAASAPIFTFPGLVDCEVFSRITTSAYKIAAHNCPNNIRQLWKELNKLIEKEDGRKWLTQEWSLCSPLRNVSDGVVLKGWVVNSIIDVAMANYPYPANFLGELPGHPVKKFCNHIKDSNLQGKQLLTQVYKGLLEWFNYTGQAKCLDTSDDGPTALGLEGWAYQSCSQMVMPFCTDGHNDMFEAAEWNLDEVLKECENEYKRKPKPYFIEKQYGGRHIKSTSNIIFSNGLLDPWSGGGVMKNVSKTTYAVLIPEGAHHLDLRASNPLDPESVVNARNFYKQIFRRWIRDYARNSIPTASCA